MEGEGREQLRLLISCRLSESTHRWREGGRNQGSHLTEADFPGVTAGHRARGSDPSTSPMHWRAWAGRPTLTHRRLLVIVLAGHQFHAARLQLNLLLD